MSPADLAKLDDPTISMNSFYPRRQWTPTPNGAEDHSVAIDVTAAVADKIAGEGSLSCRFFPAGPNSPTILFFYGNGETAVDYDSMAPLYNQVGINFFVADYRGYGRSDGFPTFSTMLADADKVLERLTAMLEARGYASRIFVMGRSMGRHPAFGLAANFGDRLNGLIIESGRPSLGNFTRGLDPATAEGLEAQYEAKVRSIDVPVLVIHGEVDTLAPVEQAVAMFQGFRSQEKRLLTIPGAGHNDLLQKGVHEYFAAIQEFVSP
jgi:pimeloyl-ACP methyl ester carboxylesterase